MSQVAAFHTAVFRSPDLQESVPPVSLEFLKGKKIEWVSIRGSFDIHELPSK